MEKYPFVSTKTFLYQGTKAVVYLIAAYYLLAFFLSGYNYFGAVDSFIPLERTICLIAAGFFAVNAAAGFLEFGKQYIVIVTHAKK